MKYKYLKNQNESFRKRIEEQNQLINSQTILINKLTKEKIDLLSKLEIKSINHAGFKNIKHSLDLQVKYNSAEYSHIDRILDIQFKPYMSNIYDRVNALKEKTIIMPIPQDNYKNAFTDAITKFASAFDEIYLGQDDEVFGTIKRTKFIKEEKPKTIIAKKSKDWYQKHNNKQRFQGKNR